LSIVRVASLEEAVDLTNQSDFGNGSCLFTKNGVDARYFRKKIQVGMLGVNIGVPAPMAFFPFSGWKNYF
jgi:malonate-semialdehyde dehydrogenase (acetylating) / methylmalonate-semialdehyde dehydrogenase